MEVDTTGHYNITLLTNDTKMLASSPEDAATLARIREENQALLTEPGELIPGGNGARRCG